MARTPGWAATFSSILASSGEVRRWGWGCCAAISCSTWSSAPWKKSGNGEIISQPKVVTADKETARILKGTEVPYQETTRSGATSVSFREASLSLEVTPQITPDGKVIMAVRVTKDEPDFINALNDVPPIRKNEVNAKVRVTDGQTIVIGGVYSTSQNKVVDKVPFFGDLPYVGRLFRRDALQEKKSELLVFLTPRIMSDQAIAVSR